MSPLVSNAYLAPFCDKIFRYMLDFDKKEKIAIGIVISILFALNIAPIFGVGSITVGVKNAEKLTAEVDAPPPPDNNDEVAASDILVDFASSTDIVNLPPSVPLASSTDTASSETATTSVDTVDVIASSTPITPDTASSTSLLVNLSNQTDESASATPEIIDATSTESGVLEGFGDIFENLISTRASSTTSDAAPENMAAKDNPILQPRELKFSQKNSDIVFSTISDKMLSIKKHSGSEALNIGLAGGPRELEYKNGDKEISYKDVFPKTDFKYDVSEKSLKESMSG